MCRSQQEKHQAYWRHQGTHILLRKSENSHALRLENVSLREPLSDLRAGNANLIRYTFGVRSYARHTGAAANKKSTKPIGGTRVFACGENSSPRRW